VVRTRAKELKKGGEIMKKYIVLGLLAVMAVLAFALNIEIDEQKNVYGGASLSGRSLVADLGYTTKLDSEGRWQFNVGGELYIQDGLNSYLQGVTSIGYNVDKKNR
jgi:hypothetical protein